MPTFGDFESFGEPLAITEDRGHVSTVWRARKSEDVGDPTFAVKCYAPQRRQPTEGQAEDALESDPAQKFLAGIKQLQKAQGEGAHGLTPIHDFGFADEGVWYATDFYPRNTLKAWIARRGGVDSAALRQVVHSIATGCLALKRARGFSHGNLKAANVFLVGRPSPLRRTPLHLADAYPAAPAQLARLARGDRRAAEELPPAAIELQDLRALGELLLQLVEGRLVASVYDYNYPVEPSPAWEHLGRDGQRWRDLCNRLLDPQLSLEKLSLESLAQEFRPSGISAKPQVVLAAAAIICLVAGVIIWKLWPHPKSTVLKPPELTLTPTNQPPVVSPAAMPVAARPTLEPNGGSHQDSVAVRLASTTSDAVIYYTVDGKDPTVRSARYGGPFTLATGTTTVKARAIATGQKDSAIASATFTVTATPVVVTPTMTPEGGNHQDSVAVTLKCATGGATMYYTVDGRYPTVSSTRYNGPFTLTTGTTTVKARGIATGQKDSAIASATFTVTATPVVVTPTMTPEGGNHQDSVAVTLKCATGGATMYYTVDGRDPTVRSTRYIGPFTLTNGTTTVKARAIATGQKDSAIANATFTVTATPVAAQPTLEPNGGSHQDSVAVKLASTTSDAVIYYTMDGKDPTVRSTRYIGPFTLTNGTTTVKARAIATGQKDSAIANATFTVTATPVAAQPTLEPNGGSHQDSVAVKLASTTINAVIYYTMDGKDPTVRSTRYIGPFTLTNGTTTVKARAIATGQKDSAIANATFTVTATPVAAQPTLEPNGGSHQDSVAVKLASTTSDAVIYYTVDGKDPTVRSTRYIGPFTLTNGTTTVKARASATGQKDSAIASATFTVTATPVAAQPTLEPNGGSHQDSVAVRLASTTSDAVIYFTVDGKDPTVRSARYGGPFTLTTGTTTVKARAIATGQKDSAIASATFTVTATPVVVTPTMTPEGGNHQDSVAVTLKCATGGATMYYTVDGRGPTVSSTRYNGPFTLTTGTTTVKARAIATGQKDSAIVSATFTVTLTPLVAISPPGVIYVDAGKQVKIALKGTGPTAAKLNYRLATLPAKGKATDPIGDSLVYTPDKKASGQDSFTFVVSDGTRDSAEAKVEITINNELVNLIAAADKAFNKGDYDVASDQAKKVLDLDPGNEEAKRLQGKITLAKDRTRLDTKLEDLRKLFGEKRPAWLKVPVSSAKEITTSIGISRQDYYLKAVRNLEAEYKQKDLLDTDRQGFLKGLIKAIEGRD